MKNKNIDKIAIVILNYNSGLLIKQCYDSLKKLNRALNIVIVDNNSNDNSKSILKTLDDQNTHIIYSKKNNGYAAGNNIGLKYIAEKMKYIDVAFVMNPDVVIDSINVLSNLYEKLKNDKQLGVITTLTIYNGKMNRPNECAWKMLNKLFLLVNGSLLGKLIHKQNFYKQFNEKNGLAYVDIVQGCFFGIKIDILKEINYLDERTFLYCEEMILHIKVKDSGYKSAVDVGNYIYHNHLNKDIELKNKKSRIFHLKCFRDSRKIVINNYIKCTTFYKKIANVFLDIDFYLKKIIILVRFW